MEADPALAGFFHECIKGGEDPSLVPRHSIGTWERG